MYFTDTVSGETFFSLCLPTDVQRVFLEDQPHGLKIEFCSEVEHGEIFVVEGLDGGRLLVPAAFY